MPGKTCELPWILNTFYFAEKYIAKKLVELDNSNNIKKSKNFNAKLKTLEKEADISLSQKQKEALKMVNENNVCVIKYTEFKCTSH